MHYKTKYFRTYRPTCKMSKYVVSYPLKTKKWKFTCSTFLKKTPASFMLNDSLVSVENSVLFPSASAVPAYVMCGIFHAAASLPVAMTELEHPRIVLKYGHTLKLLNTHFTRISIKVRKRANTRSQYNQVPHLTKDKTWECNTKTIKHSIQESQEVSPIPTCDHKATKRTNTKHEQQKMIHNRSTALVQSVKTLLLEGSKGTATLMKSMFNQKELYEP